MADSGTLSGEIAGDAALIAALASGATNEEAATRAGVSLRTVGRRLADPVFADDLATARRDLVTRSMSRLTDNSVRAADVLLDIAENAEAPASARVSAARATIELGSRLREQVDLEGRIAALEAAATEPVGGHRL